MSNSAAVRLSDEVARAIRMRDMMVKELLECLQIEYPKGSTIAVDYERGGQTYTLYGTVTGHDVRQGAAEVAVFNQATGKLRRFDVRCYPMRRPCAGGWDDRDRVTPMPAPHKRPPTMSQEAK